MNWVSGVVLYTLIWWTVLFAVLPFGTRPRPEADEASGWRGAPARPRIGVKMLATTLVSALIFLACYLVITSGWVSFRQGWLAPPED